MTSDPSSRAAEPDERELVTRARRGDVEAFAVLYHANAGRVFAVCLRLTADRGLATELVQDVFVRIWERLSSYRGDSAFGTWAYRIAVNMSLETRRSTARRLERVELDGREHGRVESTGPSIEQRIDLEKALATLPPGPRRAFVLHDVEGYQHSDIAKMTGLAEGTVRAQLHRARQLLMEALDR
jgi:RNA polymerase sigma-70 factor (ECF subfamily)